MSGIRVPALNNRQTVICKKIKRTVEIFSEISIRANSITSII